MCYQRNQLPSHYRSANTNALHPELQWQNSTVEYALNYQHQSNVLFLYVIDTALEDQELSALRESLVASISLLPLNSLIGLITFGAQVLRRT